MKLFDRDIPDLSSIREVKPGSFIFERPGALPADWCEEIIRRFEANPEQQREGVIGQLGQGDQSIKKTSDLVVSDKDNWSDINKAFHQIMGAAIREFRETYPFFKGPFKDMGYQVQRYLPGEYYHWHIDGGSHQFSERQLVAIFYLNDVDDGGQTQFLYQNVGITPKQGTLLLFPPFWTHEHRAEIVNSGNKYMATTWVVFG